MENITKQRDADKESGVGDEEWTRRKREKTDMVQEDEEGGVCVCCLYDRETAKEEEGSILCLLLPGGYGSCSTTTTGATMWIRDGEKGSDETRVRNTRKKKLSAELGTFDVAASRAICQLLA